VLTSVSVVVILGAIIATIARAVLAGDGQPATAEKPSDSTEPETMLVPATDVRVDELLTSAVELDAPIPWWRRVRSIVLLGLLVVVIGAVVAAVLGVLVVGGASLLDEALG
jgi:hypothetical protein